MREKAKSTRRNKGHVGREEEGRIAEKRRNHERKGVADAAAEGTAKWATGRSIGRVNRWHPKGTSRRGIKRCGGGKRRGRFVLKSELRHGGVGAKGRNRTERGGEERERRPNFLCVEVTPTYEFRVTMRETLHTEQELLAK